MSLLLITIIIAGLLFIAGLCEGFIESLKYQYKEVKKRLPFLSDQFWNPALSWKNKYKNHDPLQGPRFWLSTSALVWLTDAYHLMNTIGNLFLFSNVGFIAYLITDNYYAFFATFAAWAIYAGGGGFLLEWVFTPKGKSLKYKEYRYRI